MKINCNLRKYSRLVIVTDHTVKRLYGNHLFAELKHAGFDCLLLSFPAGEKNKNRNTKQKIEDAMVVNQCDRHSLILALGGGVVGDLAGFVAATYFRGIDYLQIPTTLLAMIDSSIGGKTGVNTPNGKNLIGSFYQPIAVIRDYSMLNTLPKKAILNGLFEAIKIFLTHDEKRFIYLQTHLNEVIHCEPRYLKSIIRHAVKIKLTITSQDERESAERSLLNFGHTIGHALEKLTRYQLAHGFAVGYGMLIEATIAQLLGFLSRDDLAIIQALLGRLTIHGKHLAKYDLNQLIQMTYGDKKNKNKSVQYVLLNRIGCAYIKKNRYTHAVPDHIVKQAVMHYVR